MAYIISSVLRKAFHKYDKFNLKEHDNLQDLWKQLMLLPESYGKNHLFSEKTRGLMSKVEFAHDPEYDDKYPEGLPTRLEITNRAGENFDTGLIMFPGGHSANEDVDLNDIL